MIKLWKGDDCEYEILEKFEKDPIVEYCLKENKTQVFKGIIKRMNSKGILFVEKKKK